MRIEELLTELEDIVESAWSLPISGGKAVVDVGRVRNIIINIREAVPTEVSQAKAIVADRNQIISDAKKEAEQIVRGSQEKGMILVSREEVVKQAQAKSEEIIVDAKNQSREMRKAAGLYVDDLMKRTDEVLTEGLTEFRKARQSFKTSQK